jgi:hypothetical protein
MLSLSSPPLVDVSVDVLSFTPDVFEFGLFSAVTLFSTSPPLKISINSAGL